MKHAYNNEWLYNLHLIKESKALAKSHWISADQFKSISEHFTTPLYHPNFLIRILLFIATLIGLAGVSGLFALIFLDGGEAVASIACIIYGIGSFLIADRIFINNKQHYKSGVTEAILYHSYGFILGGIIVLLDLNEIPTLWIALVMAAFLAHRYLDLISTLGALLLFSYLLFYHFFELGGVFQQIIPFIFITVFAIGYWRIKSVQRKSGAWRDVLLIIESYCLLIIYLGGNYLVVRELSVNMLDLELGPGDDIPFAFLFYALTILTPIAYLAKGIWQRDVVILRVSLLVLAFSVFTFKYYYGLNRPEVTLTIAGIILTGISLLLFRYLRVLRNGFTRENLIAEKWGDMNVEAFVISQTLGGNQVKQDDGFHGQGGEFGGGGSSGTF